LLVYGILNPVDSREILVTFDLADLLCDHRSLAIAGRRRWSLRRG
jgi:hypothetical protein